MIAALSILCLAALPDAGTAADPAGAPASVVQGAPDAPAALRTTGDRALARWLARVEPGEDERTWQTIPWLPSLWEGLLASAREGRPLLLWVMNGHPLGCT